MEKLKTEQARVSIRKEVGGLYKGLRMIFMEYLNGQSAMELPKEKWLKNAPEGVNAATTYLHNGGFVFGDLRKPNVIFVGEDVKLIDYDWSGKEVRVSTELSKRESAS
jgi:tRNA A-37 threonylcarbamoyl transferase component Bud32